MYRVGLGDFTNRVIAVEHGWLEYRYAPGGTCEMVNLEVNQEHRREGVAKRMLATLEADPLVMVLYGCVMDWNMVSRAWFTAMGFSGTLVKDFYGKDRHAVLMVKVVR